MASKRLFISYALEDGAFAARLGKFLEARGASVYRDGWARPDNWPYVVREEIRKASALVLVVPARSVPNRNNVWFEAGAAKALGKKILAVLPPDQRLSRDLPTDLADILVLDVGERPLESVADTLLHAA
jgi:hypothetical protein